MNECIIVCAGAPHPALDNIMTITEQAERVYYIGVDRGALHLVKAGYTLDIAVGDFDSVTEQERVFIQQHSHAMCQLSSEKDDTDLEVALQHVVTLPSTAHCYIFGALGGGRLDHLIANVWLAHQPRYQSLIGRLTFIEKEATMTLLREGTHCVPYQECSYFSVVGLTPIRQLSIQGAKYELPTTDLAYPVAYVSNEFVGQEVHVSFAQGTLAIIMVQES